MAFSYTEGSSADRDRVRLEIGDTDSSRALFQDAELDDFLSQEGDNVMASSATLMYQKLARRLRNRARGTTTVVPRRKDGYSVYTDSDEVTGLNILDSGIGQYSRYRDD